eukprot:384312_1
MASSQVSKSSFRNTSIGPSISRSEIRSWPSSSKAWNALQWRKNLLTFSVQTCGPARAWIDERFSDGSIHMQTISLVDPFSQRRIVTPTRGMKCTHIQAFDLDTHLERWFRFGEHDRTWRCPVCNKDSPPSNIIIDGYLMKELQDSPTNELYIKPSNASIKDKPDRNYIELCESDSDTEADSKSQPQVKIEKNSAGQHSKSQSSKSQHQVKIEKSSAEQHSKSKPTKPKPKVKVEKNATERLINSLSRRKRVVPTKISRRPPAKPKGPPTRLPRATLNKVDLKLSYRKLSAKHDRVAERQKQYFASQIEKTRLEKYRARAHGDSRNYVRAARSLKYYSGEVGKQKRVLDNWHAKMRNRKKTMKELPEPVRKF